jgi:hypothetical protein
LSKQLLIYEQVVPVSSIHHRDMSIKFDGNYEFARETNFVPLIASEFPHASADFTIVFAGAGDTIRPVAIMGLRQGENLYVTEQGDFTARYVPVFLRRYPFIFSSGDEGETFTLCVDEEFSGCNRDGRGERLFDADGEQTQYLKGVLEFLKDHQVQHQRTERFCQKINDLGLLDPMSAQFTMANGEKIALTGFLAVDRDKLKALTGEQFQELAQTDEMELIYIHLQSMRKFSSLIDSRAAQSRSKAGTAPGHEESESEPSSGKVSSDADQEDTGDT